MIIEFPPDVQITSPACNVLAVGINLNGDVEKINTASCVRKLQQFIVTTTLIDDYIPLPAGSTQDQFIFLDIGQVENPISTYQVQGLRITIASEGLYAIDEYEGPIPWTLSEGTFSETIVSPQFDVAYRADNLYTFQFTPKHTIP